LDEIDTREVVDYFHTIACPQKLGIEVSLGVELKNIIERIWLEKRLASGRGGALAKGGLIHANNTFDHRSQVLTAREWAKSGEPSAALFARTSDYFAREHADILTLTVEDPSEHSSFTRNELGASRGTLSQACSVLVASHRR
jgi:hypothetical protein